MRILYIDVNCKGSSTGQIVYSLFSECKKNGIESAICYGRGPLIKEEGIYKFGIDLETMLHALMTRLTGYTGCFSFFSTRRLIRYIKKYNPDIVHIHELHAYFVNIKPLLSFLRKNNIKTIFTNHCEFLYTGKCGHSKDCNKFQIECGKCPLNHIYPKSILFDHTKKMFLDKKNLFDGWNSFFLVTPSLWLKQKMERSFLKSKNIEVINNGIDTSIYSVSISTLKNELGIPKNNKVVLTLGPNIFSDLKGGDRFLSLAKKIVDENITFIIVGSNLNDEYEHLDNVIVLPFTSNRAQLINLYSLADCFVICSSHETYPTTSLEAQCCGAKVVGFDVGGVKETILEGNGYVVPYNDVDATKEKVLLIINEKYSKEAVSFRAKHYFSKERMFNDYLQLYKEICD